MMYISLKMLAYLPLFLMGLYLDDFKFSKNADLNF